MTKCESQWNWVPDVEKGLEWSLFKVFKGFLKVLKAFKRLFMAFS